MVLESVFSNNPLDYVYLKTMFIPEPVFIK